MKYIIYVIVSLFVFAVSALAQVDDIVNKHIAAIGGREVITGIRSMSMEIEMSTMGMEIPGKVTTLNGKGYRSEMQYDAGTSIQCVTDKSGWRIVPFVDPARAALTASEYRSAKREIEIGGELFDYAAKGSKAELLGQEKGFYKIKLTRSDGAVATYFIDPKTFFINKIVDSIEWQGQPVERVVTYSDYKKIEPGFFVPMVTFTTYGENFSSLTRVKKIEFNKPVDPAIFEMPK